MKRIILTAAMLCVAAAAFAGPLTPNPTYVNVPAASPTRLSLGAGIDFAQFQTVGDTPFPEWSPKSAWQPGLFAAYVISDKVAATGSACINTENHWIEWRVGLRLNLWRGAQ